MPFCQALFKGSTSCLLGGWGGEKFLTIHVPCCCMDMTITSGQCLVLAAPWGIRLAAAPACGSHHIQTLRAALLCPFPASPLCFLTGDVDKTVNGVREGQEKFGETWQLLDEVALEHPLLGVPKPASLGAQSQLKGIFPPAQHGFWYQPGVCVLSCTGKQECRTSINRSGRPSRERNPLAPACPTKLQAGLGAGWLFGVRQDEIP